jgi:YidC/Oxa1 family membrane protein insertase
MGISKEVLRGQILPRLTELGWVNSLNASYEQISQTQFISSHFDQFAGISDKLSQINYNFLGMNLGDNPKFNFLWTTDWSDSSVWLPGLLLFLLPIASGILAFLSSKVSMKMTAQPDSQQAGSAKTMMLFMPLINVYFAFIMPGAIGVYIIASMVFQTIQEVILTKHYTKVLEAEEAVKFEEQRKREAELEAKRLETERKKLENSTQKNPNTSKKKQVKNERQEQLEKAVEWEKKHVQKADEEKEEPSREGHRRYARGRAYNPDRFAALDQMSDSADEKPDLTEEEPVETERGEAGDVEDEAGGEQAPDGEDGDDGEDEEDNKDE